MLGLPTNSLPITTTSHRVAACCSCPPDNRTYPTTLPCLSISGITSGDSDTDTGLLPLVYTLGLFLITSESPTVTSKRELRSEKGLRIDYT